MVFVEREIQIVTEMLRIHEGFKVLYCILRGHGWSKWVPLGPLRIAQLLHCDVMIRRNRIITSNELFKVKPEEFNHP